MIIKPPLKNDSLNVIFNGNYDIEEKSKKQDKYEFASELKKINIELKDGDVNKIVDNIVKHYNINSIVNMTINYGETQDIILIYTGTVRPSQINIKSKYINTIDITAKYSIVNILKTNIKQLRAKCYKLKVGECPSESMEATGDVIEVRGGTTITSCKFNNINASVFRYFQHYMIINVTYNLLFTNCNIKKCHCHIMNTNYKLIVQDSTIESMNLYVGKTNMKFEAYNSNNIKINITAYRVNNLSFEGNNSYTISSILYSHRYDKALTLSYKDQVIISKSVNLIGINLKNIDFPEKTLKQIKNVLLQKFDEEYEGDDFLERIETAIVQKTYISVANLAKAIGLIKSKTKIKKLYNLTHIYSDDFPDGRVIDYNGESQMYSSKDIIDVLKYADTRGVLDELLDIHRPYIKQFLSSSSIPEWLVKKCNSLNIDIKNIFVVKNLLKQEEEGGRPEIVNIITGYCDAVNAGEFVINDFDSITNDERAALCTIIANSNVLYFPTLADKIKYILKQSHIDAGVVTKAYKTGKFNTEQYYLLRILVGGVELEERVNILMGLNIEHINKTMLDGLEFTDDESINNKVCILKIAIADETAFEVFFDAKVFMSDAYVNYAFKQEINDTLLSAYSVITKLNLLNNTEINKIIGYNPSKYTDLNYGSPIVNQLLLMERRKIKNNIMYRKLPRNTNTIYLDTVNELKSSYNKNSNEYNELKWVENNININGAGGADLNKIDDYLIDIQTDSKDNNEMKVYKLITNIKKSYIEEKNIELVSQSLKPKQKILRMNLKNLSELNALIEPATTNMVSSYIAGKSGHPINKSHLTLVWLRFNIDEDNKSIWVNETQTDMTKILGFGTMSSRKFTPNELGNKLNDKLAYLIIYQLQFWVAKHYPDYTVVLPSYTTRKKIIGGDPTINGYDNPAKKLKFTKGEYKDTPWYNISQSDGLVWIWSPLTESKQV